MSAKLIKANQEEAIFLIEIDAKIFEKALLEEYKKATADENNQTESAFLSTEAILRQYPELDKIASKTLEQLMPSYYMNAVKELGLQPITFPKITPRSTTLGQPCVIEVRVGLEPKVELKQFEGLEATYTPVIATEEDVTRQISGLRKQHDAETDDEKLLSRLPFDTMEVLTENIRSSFETMAKEKTNFNKKEAVIRQLIAVNPITLTDEVVEQQIMLEIDRMSRQMGQQAMQRYMKSSGRTIDDLKREARPWAETTVKKMLLLSAVVEKISPEVTEEDIKEMISRQPGSMPGATVDYETQRKRFEEMPGAMEQIIHSIRLEKTTDYIVAKAILHENKPMNIMDELPPGM